MEPDSPANSAATDDDNRVADRLQLLINAPESDHRDWPQVIHSLRQVEPNLKRLVEDDSSLAWLIDEASALVKKCGPVDLAGLRLYPTHGYITYRPIFAALAVQPHGGVRPDLVRTLQAFLLVATAKREHYVLDDDCRSPIEKAGLAVRKIASKGLGESVAQAIGSAKSVDELYSLVVSWLGRVADPPAEDSEDSKKEAIVLNGHEKETIDLLSILLIDAKENRVPRHRASGETKPQEKVTTRIERSGSDDDQGGGGRYSNVIESELDVAVKKERRNEGLPPLNEFGSRVSLSEYVSSRDPRFVADQMTERQANRRIVLQARGYKSTQQWTPNRTEILHLPALQALLASDRPKDPKSSVRWEMLALMLFTGCTVDDILKFEVWEHPVGFYEAPTCPGIFADTGLLIVPVYDLPQSWQPDKALAAYFDRPDHKLDEHYRRSERQILLKLPSYFEVGEKLLDRARRQVSGRLFPRLKEEDIGRVKSALEARVKALNARFHCTMTLTRISRHLANSLYALDGDIAEALLLSQQHKSDNDPRLYYYAPSRGHLARQYDRVWHSLAATVNDSPSPSDDYGFSGDTHIGSAAVPLISRISTDVVAMADCVAGYMASRGRRSQRSWWLIHNILTAYVIRQIQWMTGIRAVRDPIELRNYDPRTGFLQVNDKDTADQYGARVVWLLPPVQRQIQVYLQQAELVANAWSKSPVELAFRFFEDNGELLETSLQTLDRFTACVYPYATNAHRHYQRTRLRELGVDAGYVDAWLGHGGMGREPYARHSAITPKAVRLALTPALETIWEELAWQVLPKSH